MSQNKFEVLTSRVMQCNVREMMIRKQEMVRVECFKCGKEGHKCRVSPLERRKGVASSGKGSACGQATKGTAKRIEEKSGACPMIEDTGAL